MRLRVCVYEITSVCVRVEKESECVCVYEIASVCVCVYVLRKRGRVCVHVPGSEPQQCHVWRMTVQHIFRCHPSH